MRRAITAVFLVALATLAVEFAARISRLGDVPLYKADRHIGYIPAPDQHGAFAWTHRWAFNHLSMATKSPFRENVPDSMVLIGDSIVLGGNPYRDDERLGPQLSLATGRTVWPVAAGSWALQNELQYLLDHPRVVHGVDRIVFVSNSGDFGVPSSWANELTHPREHHWSVAWQLFRKFVWPPSPPPVTPAMRVPVRPWGTDLRTFVAGLPRPAVFVLYPTKAELAQPIPCGMAIPAALRSPHIRLFCIKSSRNWKPTLYRDDIHPTAEGMRILASLIALVVGRPSATSMQTR